MHEWFLLLSVWIKTKGINSIAWILAKVISKFFDIKSPGHRIIRELHFWLHTLSVFQIRVNCTLLCPVHSWWAFLVRWGSNSTGWGTREGACSHWTCVRVEVSSDSFGITVGDIPSGQVTTGGNTGAWTNQTGHCRRCKEQVINTLREYCR